MIQKKFGVQKVLWNNKGNALIEINMGESILDNYEEIKE